jgi:anti-sigma factor RsiW
MTDRDDFSELISALIDGEVTPEEKAMIEQRLVDSAEDRRLFEEMRSIRDGLRSLPRRKLGKDLSQSVLRSAERAMLSAEATEPSQPHDRRETLQAAPDGREGAIVATPPTPPQQGNWRAWIWVGVTIAAAVLIMVMRNLPGLQQPVAVREPTSQPDEVDGDVISPAAVDPAEVAEMEMADETGGSRPPTSSKGVREDRRPRFGAVEEDAAGAAPQREADRDHDDFGAGVTNSQVATGGRPGKMSEGESSVPESLARRLPETRKAKKPGDGTADDLFAQSVTEELASIQIPTDRLLVVILDVSPGAVRDHSLATTLARNAVSFEYAAEQLPGIREAFGAGQQQARSEADEAAGHRAFRSRLLLRENQHSRGAHRARLYHGADHREQPRSRARDFRRGYSRPPAESHNGGDSGDVPANSDLQHYRNVARGEAWVAQRRIERQRLV